MKRPYNPRPGESIRAWHMRTHAEAIIDVDARVKRLSGRRPLVEDVVAGTSGPCNFGEVITYQDGEDTLTGIRGGLFQCGDLNFSVPNQALDLETDGKWFIQIILTGVTPNVDDDEEIFLPGIETASGTPTWDFKTWTDGGNYDSTTNPTSPGATGTLVVPSGILTIADGSYTFDAVACGNIVATQCAGILNHTRG